jgi:hypothetical protein
MGKKMKFRSKINSGSCDPRGGSMQLLDTVTTQIMAVPEPHAEHVAS